MLHYEITLDRKQYATIEKMLSRENAQHLAMNEPINGHELFSDMIEDIYSPVEDGWSTLDIVLQESTEKLDLLRTMTGLVFPENKDFFVNQLGNDDITCKDDFDILIILEF